MTQPLEIRIQPSEVPPHLRAALHRYAVDRIPTGGFLRAVLENDLLGAVARADSENAAILSKIVKYIYHELPNGCYGSPEKVEAWLGYRVRTEWTLCSCRHIAQEHNADGSCGECACKMYDGHSREVKIKL